MFTAEARLEESILKFLLGRFVYQNNLDYFEENGQNLVKFAHFDGKTIKLILNVRKIMFFAKSG